MYLTESMHLNLCQDLKINLPQPPVTILVLCWLMHCNFSVLFLCHVYSLLLAVQSTSTRVCPSQPHDSSNKITQGPSWCTCIISNNSYFPLFYQLPSVLKKKNHQKTCFHSKLFLHYVAILLESAALLQGRWGILWQLQLKLKWKFLMNSIWKWNFDWNSSSSVFIFSLTWIEFILALYLLFTIYCRFSDW